MHEGVCYQDWMIADTYDGDINMLSLELPNSQNSYTHAYNIGKYMLTNLEHAKILDYAYEPEK